MRYTLAALLFLIPLGNLAAAEKPFFAAVDVYDPSQAEQKYKKAGDVFDQLSTLPSGIKTSSATSSVSSSPGLGIRFGVFQKRVSSWEFAGSAGYILGPKVTTVVTNTDVDNAGTITRGRTEVVTTSNFIRFLVEGGRRIELPKKLALRLGGAVGLSAATIKRDINASGSAASRVSGRGEVAYSYGATIEFSPSVIAPLGGQELELGARIAYMPARGKDPAIADFDWTPLSVFAAVRFGPNSLN